MLSLVLGGQLWVMFRAGGGSRMRILVVGLVVAVILFQAVPWEEVRENLSTVTDFVEMAGEEDPNALETRGVLWLGALTIFGNNPIVGVGYGNFGHQFLNYLGQQEWKNLRRTLWSPHSSILGILAELGLVGVILWTWLLVAAFRILAQSMPTSNEEHHQVRRAQIQAVFLSFLVMNTYSFMAITHNDKLFWLLLGLIAVYWRLAKRSYPDPAETEKSSCERS